MSRVQNTAKNIAFGYASTLVTLLLQFISRTIFIHILGDALLGVNGLFTNVLGVLSLAELGIGTAMNFSLYKPVAEGNREQIKSLMQLYKVWYRRVGIIVACIGLAILPFLRFIITGAEGIENVHVYYLIFLFNTVSTYFVSYKFSLPNAEQKNYIVTNVTTLTTVVSVAAQIVSLLVLRDFMAYLLVGAAIALGQKVFINAYLNKKYPELKEKDVAPLSPEELQPIKKNILALVWHKIGEISVYQTGNIVVSAFINITVVGYMSNYNMLITAVSGFINIIFNSAVASLGNLMATGGKEKQYEVFKIYRFLGFWLYGFSAIAFCVLLSPFISLWVGSDRLVSEWVVVLLVADYYLRGHRICINNLKVAAGVFAQDKYVAVIQAVVNVGLSILLVQKIGLPGVYLAALLQGLIATVIKPIIVYKNVFQLHPKHYFWDGVKYAVLVVLAGLLCWGVRLWLPLASPWVSFIVLAAAVAVIPNALFLLFSRNSPELRYVKGLVLSKLKRRTTP